LSGGDDVDEHFQGKEHSGPDRAAGDVVWQTRSTRESKERTWVSLSRRQGIQGTKVGEERSIGIYDLLFGVHDVKLDIGARRSRR